MRETARRRRVRDLLAEASVLGLAIWARRLGRRVVFWPAYRRTARRHLALEEVKRLQIGCGGNVLPGWLNSDVEAGPQVVFLDARKRFRFRDGVFDYVFSEHLIEHLDVRAAKGMIRECYRVLKPGGVIRISTPDLGFLVDLYGREKSEVQERYVRWACHAFVGCDVGARQDVYVINNFFRDWGHRFIYDFETMRACLEEGGFTRVTRCRVGESEHEGLRGLETHGERIGEEFNRLESLVVEAQKPV